MAKVKIPKRIGGVKIPKQVRKKARKAVKMAESPVVREFAAAALGAAAQAKANKATARLEGNGRSRSEDHEVRIDADRLAETIRSAALDGLRRFLDGFEEGLRTATAQSPAQEEDGSEAPKPRGRGRGARANVIDAGE